MRPLRKVLVKRPQDGQGSTCNDFPWDKIMVTACPIQIDDLLLPLG